MKKVRATFAVNTTMLVYFAPQNCADGAAIAHIQHSLESLFAIFQHFFLQKMKYPSEAIVTISAS
eukprot:127189-Ditylum_brightwellii.AAC.1